VLKRWEAVQHVQQVGRAELSRSTRGRDLLCQPRQLELLTAGYFHHRENSTTTTPAVQLILPLSGDAHRRS
jgi:hypothetical protein